jgi:uncharacterized protein YkwD
LLIGAGVVAAIAIASVSALVFQGREDSPSASSEPRATATTTRDLTTTTSTTTSTTSTTTTTTVAPAPTTAAPAPVPAPAAAEVAPPPPASAPACDGFGSGVIDAMNGDRSANGVAPLCGNGQLANYAQGWANWMAQNQTLTHQDLNSVLAATAFSTIGENVLDGPGGLSVDQLEVAWMQSPGHRDNILKGAYTAAGVGIAHSSDGRVWVAVDFGG